MIGSGLGYDVIVSPDLERSCQECTSYAPESQMVSLSDGRMVCKPCARKVRKVGAERAQLSMFGQNSLKF